MSNKLNSVTLFLAQITNHSDELSLLLSVGPSEPIEAAVLERARLSTSMLATSASLLELEGFNRFLTIYDRLLIKYRDANLLWDEGIAQITSEVIEREDGVVDAGKDIPTSGLKSIIPDDEWNGLTLETEEIIRIADMALAEAEAADVAAAETADVTEAEATEVTVTEATEVTATEATEVTATEAAEVTATEATDLAEAEATDVAEAEATDVAEAEATDVAEAEATDLAEAKENPAPVTPTPAAPATAEPAAPAKGALRSVMSRERPLGESLHELERQAQALLEDWNDSPWNPRHAPAEVTADVRRRMILVSFYAQSIEQILALKAIAAAPVVTGSLTPVRCAMQDFVRSLCAGDERRIDLSFVGEHAIDTRLLTPVVRVLQNMITDTYQRCKDSHLDIEIVVQEQNGGLFWSLRDNGTSMVSDSAVDREEYLAFYPGLKYVRQILGRLHSMLWVEPSENPGTRFSFSTPHSPDGDAFMVWHYGANRFAVLPNEVGDILTPEEADVRTDARGEYLLQHSERVPLLRLDHLYDGAPSEGNLIVLLGFLEKRVAFYVNGESELLPGTWLPNSIGPWKDHKGIAQINEERIPLVEAGGLLGSYIELFNEMAEAGVAGGDTADQADLSRTQAVNEKDEVSPPENKESGADAEVLVVERSEALRNTFSSILSDRGVRAHIVAQVEDAIECLEQSAPSVIISEFRVPSMAAKVLVERLKSAGKKVPVLVTTTHQGDNAELLVQKLGAAGHISKPIDRSEVLDRLGDFIKVEGPVAGKT